MRRGADGGRRSVLPWGVARVRGESMAPTLRSGDRLLVRYGVSPAAGEIVVAALAHETVVKRAVESRATGSGTAGWWLLSDNPAAGVDSRHRGAVPADDVLAVARLRLWPRPRWLRAAPPPSRRTPGAGAVED